MPSIPEHDRDRPGPAPHLPQGRRTRATRALVAVLVGLLLLAPIALILDGVRTRSPGPADPSSPPPTWLRRSADSDRNAFLQPFVPESIWNLPIGDEAVYVPANITKATAWGMTVDQDVLILTPNAPMTQVFYNDDAWNGGSRCDVEGGALFEAPIPERFVVPGARHGYTPNFSTAILARDNRTLIQGQPMARCSEGDRPTMWWSQTHEDLYGTGFSGAHGGSMLSSIGGTIRFGELVPGGVIPHALKVNLDGWANYWYDNVTRGFRWPATAADSCASGCYRGSNPALRMGSLLALKPDYDFSKLETEAAEIVARAFVDYGGYVVDNTGWSVYALSTEYSPQNGWLEDEFEALWGFPIDPQSRNNPWSRDMDRIFLSLHVVNNWKEALWETVAASNGTLGVGGGAPRVVWAAAFGEIPPPDLTAPSATAHLSGTVGTYFWYRSPVTVSLNASDGESGLASIWMRVDGGAWKRYWYPVVINGDGRHRIEFFATDVAGNDAAVQTLEFGIDRLPPTTKETLYGIIDADGVYRSPVSVTLTATDAGAGVKGIEVRRDGGAWTTYWYPFTVSGEGPHRIEVRSTDVLGNAEATKDITFVIDTTTPITSHALAGARGSAGWYVSSVTVTLSATTPTGRPAFPTYQLDGGPWVEYAGPFVVLEGRHTLVYRASDAAGHVSRDRSVSIDVDVTAPAVRRDGDEAIAPGDTLSWTGSDPLSGIVRYEVSIDGGPWRDIGTATSMAGPWAEGAHAALVRATDAAGNQGTAMISFTVGTGAPPDDPTKVAILSPEPGVAGPLLFLVVTALGAASAYGYASYRQGWWGRRSRPDDKKGETAVASETNPAASAEDPAPDVKEDTASTGPAQEQTTASPESVEASPTEGGGTSEPVPSEDSTPPVGPADSSERPTEGSGPNEPAPTQGPTPEASPESPEK